MSQTQVEGKPVYRMNRAGYCPRALSAQRLGYEPAQPPEYLERAAEEGKRHEEWVKEELRAEGLAVVDEQKEVVLDYDHFLLVGHIDGVVAGNGDDQLLEVKSMSQYEFDRWMRDGFKGFPEYEAQVQCYLEATGLARCLYIVKNRSSGYKDRQTVTRDKAKFQQVVYKLRDVENHALGGMLMEATFDPQSIQCQRCLYQHLCITRPEPTEVDVAMLDQAVELWRKGGVLVDEGQALIDKARLTLGSYASKLDTKKFVHNQLAVQLIVQHRISYDRKVLEQTVPEELLAPARREQDVEQLRINDLMKE